ncbi:MAG: hypothetical protein QNJ31_03935 [Candidatus Caenarcaniphilales bacterium]|nr:hypothetical protein [Candidatus Caenarcaniphilales bacterium]
MKDFPLGDMPLPGSPWLFVPLLILIFWLHLVAMWLMFGSLIVGIVEVVKNKVNWKESKAIRYLPVITALVINLGVPPLLFLQVLYSPFFFSSSVIISVPWLAIFFLLMIGYGFMYLARYGAQQNWQAVVCLVVSLISVTVISFIFSNNMSLMIKPEYWKELYSYTQNGLNLYPNLPEVVSRWLWVLSAVFAAGTAMLQRSKNWVIPSSIISIVTLIVYRGFLSTEVLSHSLVSGGIVVDLVLAAGVLLIPFLKLNDKSLRILLFAWVGLKGAAVVAIRHGIRSATLDPVYPLNQLPVQSQPGLITIFLIALAIGVIAVSWMYLKGRKELAI